MTEWWRHLKGRPFYWVLDGTLPAADLFMLQYVVERPSEASPLRAARLALAESREVEALKRHLEQGSAELWEPRYETWLWTLRVLAELGVPGDDERIAEALDGVLDRMLIEDEGEPTNGPAIVLHTALAFGFHEDERVQAGVARIEEVLRQDGLSLAEEARADWLVQAAMAFAERPEGERDGGCVGVVNGAVKAIRSGEVGPLRKVRLPNL
jgi:hypothetical protein